MSDVRLVVKSRRYREKQDRKWEIRIHAVHFHRLVRQPAVSISRRIRQLSLKTTAVFTINIRVITIEGQSMRSRRAIFSTSPNVKAMKKTMRIRRVILLQQHCFSNDQNKVSITASREKSHRIKSHSKVEA